MENNELDGAQLFPVNKAEERKYYLINECNYFKGRIFNRVNCWDTPHGLGLFSKFIVRNQDLLIEFTDGSKYLEEFCKPLNEINEEALRFMQNELDGLIQEVHEFAGTATRRNLEINKIVVKFHIPSMCEIEELYLDLLKKLKEVGYVFHYKTSPYFLAYLELPSHNLILTDKLESQIKLPMYFRISEKALQHEYALKEPILDTIGKKFTEILALGPHNK